MFALTSDLSAPRLECGVDLIEGLPVSSFERVVLHIAHAVLHFALLLRAARGRWIHSKAVVASQLSIASIEFRVSVIDCKGCSNHRCLQVVWDDHFRHPAEVLEGCHVQVAPGFLSLVEDHSIETMPTVPQHHHEDAGLT